MTSPASINTQSQWGKPSALSPWSPLAFIFFWRWVAMAPTWREEPPLAMTMKSAISVLPARSMTTTSSALSSSRDVSTSLSKSLDAGGIFFILGMVGLLF